MHFVGRVDWSSTASPQPSSATSHLLARKVLVGRDQGAVHTELAVGELGPGGCLGRHVHSFEEALYVLEGELLMDLDGHVYRLVTGDYTVMPIGVRHGLANASDAEVRWLSVNTPLR